MKPAMKKAWVKALRSGKYRKGKAYLRRKGAKYDTYCCLGVLCDVNKVRWRSKVQWRAPDGFYIGYYKVSGAIGSLTPSRLKQFGLSHATQNTLISANDTKGWSFNRIATWIEKNL